jgi:hypothetical protein
MSYEIDRHPRDTFERPERGDAAPSRKAWSTPQVITGSVDDTELGVGTGADGGAAPTDLS